MRRLTLSVVLVLAVSTVLFGCKKSPGDQLLAHLDALVGVLEENKGDAAKAGEAIEAWMKAHEAELAALAGEMKREFEGITDLADLSKKAQPFLEASQKIQARVAKLTQEAPEVMSHPRVIEALASLNPVAP